MIITDYSIFALGSDWSPQRHQRDQSKRHY